MANPVHQPRQAFLSVQTLERPHILTHNLEAPDIFHLTALVLQRPPEIFCLPLEPLNFFITYSHLHFLIYINILKCILEL